MSHYASTPNRQHPDSKPTRRPGRRIGDILVAEGQLKPSEQSDAQERQKGEGLRPGEMLQGLQCSKETTVLAALGQQMALPVIDLETEPPSLVLAQLIDPKTGIFHGFVIWKQLDDVLIVAISDPAQISVVQRELAEVSTNLRFVLATRSAILRYYQNTFSTLLSKAANRRCQDEFSSRSWAGPKTKLIGLAFLSALLIAVAVAPATLIAAILGWILIALIANSGFKLLTLMSFLRADPENVISKPPQKLPKISIMVPLLHESSIVDRLIARMSALKYPPHLLEVCLVYEENDNQTKAHLDACRLPYWMRKIEVPVDGLQTKPRALNYALDFCRGDIIGIYDAEDAPEPDQLYKVVNSFQNAGDDVACVQCRLDYYNSKTNWLSRCFTIEYAILFRVVLPGLERLRLPIPLGGTSIFFRRDRLEELGRWDAHNVTEDADLGMRLHRRGYRCICAPATTYEEANFRILPWVRQRSRWLKGFLQTWVTHMRHPIELYRNFGPLGFLVFHILFLGTFTSFAAAPLVLPLWAFSFGYEIPLYQAVSSTFLNILLNAFIATECLLLVLGYVALRQRKEGGLFAFLPMMLLYWPLGSLAAYKALYEFFARPAYWDKTQHGINDREYQGEIDRLTKTG